MTTPEIFLHDTSTRTKRRFEPLDRRRVRMYACGPTVYDRIHIGNGRMFVVFDTLYRLLRAVYPKVIYVRNITDVDDKINARAAERNIPIAELTAETERLFHEDVAALGVLEPDVEPRATAHIPQMIGLIERLIEKGHAYAAEGHVLFDVPSMPEYGKLSGLDRDALVAGARVEVAPYKTDPADFVLWKPSTEDLPGWDSPWGHGRPGWHLECSAMSVEYLGPDFDIHGGGLDLVFPHHENEIAQSLCGDPDHGFARFWVHNGHLSSEGEKMSKSLGNFYLVSDLLDEFPGEALRLALLKTHYRQPMDFTKAGLAEAKADLDGFYATLHAFAEVEPQEAAADTVLSALADDLNTPAALVRLHEVRSALNALDPAAANAEVAKLKGQLLSGGILLGLLQADPAEWRRGTKSAAGTDDDSLDPAAIEEHIAQRIAARAAKNFAEADRIRDSLAKNGIVLEDLPDGSTDWRREG
jgi:cysteinyl-tRNA synthetase